MNGEEWMMMSSEDVVDKGQKPEQQEKPVATSLWPNNGWSSFTSLVSDAVNAVKKQTTEISDVYKRDLGELATVVSTTSGLLAGRLKDLAVASSEDLTSLIASSSPDQTEQDAPRQYVASEAPIVLEESSVPLSPPQPVLPENNSVSVKRPTRSHRRDPEAMIKQFSDDDDIVIEVDLEAMQKKVSKAADAIMGNFGSGLNQVSSFMSNIISVSATGDESRHSRALAKQKSKVVMDRRSALIAQVSANPDTFLTDPQIKDPQSTTEAVYIAAPEFAAFKANFDFSLHFTKISRLLKDDSVLEELMEKLVPERVSALDFWTRYFYKIAIIDREENLRKRLINDANKSQAEEEVGWESSDDEADRKNLPEVDVQYEAKRPTEASSPPRDAAQSPDSISNTLVASNHESCHPVIEKLVSSSELAIEVNSVDVGTLPVQSIPPNDEPTMPPAVDDVDSVPILDVFDAHTNEPVDSPKQSPKIVKVMETMDRKLDEASAKTPPSAAVSDDWDSWE